VSFKYLASWPSLLKYLSTTWTYRTCTKVSTQYSLCESYSFKQFFLKLTNKINNNNNNDSNNLFLLHLSNIKIQVSK